MLYATFKTQEAADPHACHLQRGAALSCVDDPVRTAADDRQEQAAAVDLQAG